MIRTLLIFAFCLLLAGCGVYLVGHAVMTPDAGLAMRLFLGCIGTLQVLTSLAAMYLAVKFNPLLITYRNTELEGNTRQLKAKMILQVKAMQPSHPTAESAATAGLDSLVEEPERSKASLGEGTPAYYVGLDQLATYTSELDPCLLLLGGFRQVFPVVVDGEVKYGVAVAKENDGSWRFAELGFAPLAAAIAKARADATAGHPGSGSFILVDVPAMSHSFLGFKEGEMLYLTCLSNWPSSPLKFGETLPANEALAKLQPQAAEKLKHYSEPGGDMLGG
jgi:hypothetical protein